MREEASVRHRRADRGVDGREELYARDEPRLGSPPRVRRVDADEKAPHHDAPGHFAADIRARGGIVWVQRRAAYTIHIV